MRLALIHPKGTYISSMKEVQEIIENSSPFFKRLPQFRDIPHLGLLTLGALAEKDFDVIDYIDENVAHDITYIDKTYDLVCISGMTHQAFRAYEIAKHFQARGMPVIIGGVHASLLPEEAQIAATSVVIGEVEGVWEEIIRDFRVGSLKKFYKGEKELDISKSPVPKFDLIDLSRFDVYPVQTTRGCPHQCDFCVVHKIYGRKYRKKTIDHILASVERLKEITQKNSPVVFFTDDNMFADKSFSKELLHALISYKIKWCTQTDISIGYDDELLRLIRKSGGFQILIGFETLNQKNLLKIEKWKANQLANYENLIKKIQDYGICIVGTFMVGLDEDDESVFSSIHEFVLKTGIFDAQILIATPLPGTELIERLKQEGRLLKDIFWDRCNLTEVNYQPKKMSIKELEQGYIWLYKNLYTPEDIEKKTQLLKKSMIVYRELVSH